MDNIKLFNSRVAQNVEYLMQQTLGIFTDGGKFYSPDPAVLPKDPGYLFLIVMFALGGVSFMYGPYYVSLSCLHLHTTQHW